ncbi:sigma-70 family RNA polymerase sigma factor [Actinoplanes sp. M2I2]|uniref:sigma-70 family RNA polymerase sigma factor n=1 Tax=Actinoplanes sp. M2I2 TaxID=1734444 RepID=UPI00202227D4|nr:sigma-70 family RNA polymerase sigma factor [Actinoplanes sp. M2I2]
MTTLSHPSVQFDSARQRCDAERRLAEVHAAHAGPLLRFLRGLTREPHAAEDLLQETMLRVWRRWDLLPDGEENVRRWLYTIGRRVSIDAARVRRVRPQEVELLDVFAKDSGEDTADIAVAHEALSGAFHRLSAGHGQVLRELYFNGLSLEEVARRLDIPVGTVKSRAHYAVRFLRSAVISSED